MNWFHRHRMQPVDVRHGTYTIGGGQATLVLRRCHCSKHDTETITGHWPAERFLTSEESR